VQFQLDGANVGALDTTAPYAFSWNTATATNGTHTLRAIATDTSNNSTTSAGVTVTVNNVVDTTPPTVSITAPANGATVSGTVNVTANASDNVAVASVQFQLDGASVGALDTTAPYAFSWNTATATNGAHTLRAIAKDSSNNSTTSAGVTVTVNNVADTAPPSVPTGLTATVTSSSQINLTWNASTDNVGVTGYNVFRGGAKIGTSATTSYFDSGLTASTSYTYNVSAFDAAGNTSAQSASATATTLASSGGGIPSALGWYQIPNTLMSNVCPPGLNCANVIVAWSGGIADTTRNRLIVWGGGHTDYDGNEVYALNLGANPISLTRLNNPSPPASSCVETLSDGTPPSRHTYDGLAYITHVDRMMSWVGSMAPTGCATNDTWTLLLSNLQWTNQSPAGKYPGPNGGVGASDYDPNTKNVFAYTESYGQFASYNYDSNTWTALSNGQGVNNQTTAVVDPKRKLFLIFGAGQVAKFDISGNDTSYTLVTLKGSNCTFASADAPGVAYDPVQDRVVGWSGGNTAYLYNPDTDSCTSVTYPNGPGAQQSLGTYGRFRYFPALGVFAVVNDASQNAYALRLTSAGTGGAGPNISNVAATSISTTGATITWTTDVAATSQVEYGTTTAYGTMTALDASPVTSHTVSLTGLTISTLYHYRVHSKNSAGIESISGDFAFSTSSSTDATPPTVSLTAPTAGSTLSGAVAVNATASDNVAVASVQFLLDGANLGAAVTSAPYTTNWDTTTATNSAHTLSAKATDTSGNVGNATGVAVTVSNSASGPTQDFQARCAAAGVVVCEGWDDPTEFVQATGGGGYANGLYPGDDGNLHGSMDTTNKVSGAGSLMFTIDQNATPNVTGYWRANFGQLGSLTAFGENSTFYMQFRWRVDPNMLGFDWTTVSNEGWKVFIAYGPIPGPSCTGAQFVQENTFQRNIATAYASCGTPSLATNNGVPPYLLEQGDYNCPYNSSGGYTSNANCFAYLSNTWMTEYWIVQTGTYGTASTHFTAYIAADGQPLKKWLDLPNFVFNSGPAAGDALESILLGPYMSGANGTKPNPTAHMWFDELIISTQPIAAPKF
jgi:chitodextrinase